MAKSPCAFPPKRRSNQNRAGFIARPIFPPGARDCANSIPLADYALSCHRLALARRGFPCEISPAAVPLHCTRGGEIHKRTDRLNSPANTELAEKHRPAGGRILGCLSTPFLRPPSSHHLLLACPPPRRVRERDQKPRQRRPATVPPAVTVFAFADFFMRCRARRRWLPASEASSKRQDDGQRFQKKAMKTTISNKGASAPANVRPASVSNTSSADKERAFAKHSANRELSTQKVLDYLRTQLPQQYELAEIVGKWI